MLGNEHLDAWAWGVLADPITKQPAGIADFKIDRGVIDARVFLKNTLGYSDWAVGQDAYEKWEADSEWYRNEVAAYGAEIDYDRPIYEHFKIAGDVLDLGGGAGTVREFLQPAETRFLSIDPFLSVLERIPPSRREAYRCLSQPLNFICAMGEFLPIQTGKFDWVHMRSMLDHVQVPDLVLCEARRVLRLGGRVLVGMTVEGGKTGAPPSLFQRFKSRIKEMLELLGVEKYKDFHTWHPTYKNLLKLLEDNGFIVLDSYWQPYWNDRVVYVLAEKAD